ncbi:MAG: nitroreductase family protein [Coriobacteriia bacterium]|nr:nitroreductase family protein [Coriobacteriia bacterium]
MLLPIPPVPLDPAWYDAIRVRTSKRNFDCRAVSPEDAAALDSFIERFRPIPQVRIELVQNRGDDLFTGYVGSYGKIRGSRTAAVFVAPEGEEVAAGYVGEAFVLEAQRLGLGTCWVAGSYDRKRAASITALAPGERIASLTPVGYAVERAPADERLMRKVVRADARKPLSELAPGAGSDAWPLWATEAAEAARWAPTGGNGQPQRLRFEDGALVVGSTTRKYWTAPIDLGIVMLHAELGALHAGVRGEWEPAEAPDTARLVPKG